MYIVYLLENESLPNLCFPFYSRQTMLIKLDATLGSSELLYLPGDHVAIYPENSQKLVDAILIRLHNAPAPDQLIKIEVMTERSTPLGKPLSTDLTTERPTPLGKPLSTDAWQNVLHH